MTGTNGPGRYGMGGESEPRQVPGSPPAGGASPSNGEHEPRFDPSSGFGGAGDARDEDGDAATEIVSGEAPSEDQLGQEEDELKAVMAERDEYLDSLRRLQAEFENYRKRVTKQQSDQTARAALSLVEKLLPVLDTLDLATTHLEDAESNDGRALLAVSGQLRDVLTKEGLERVDPVGETFDPTAHEAVGQLPAEEPPGANAEETSGAGVVGGGVPSDRSPSAPGEPVVAEVMRPGYRWRDVVVRPAMVVVRG
jgi:molecular chaperone GrpE